MLDARQVEVFTFEAKTGQPRLDIGARDLTLYEPPIAIEDWFVAKRQAEAAQRLKEAGEAEDADGLPSSLAALANANNNNSSADSHAEQAQSQSQSKLVPVGTLSMSLFDPAKPPTLVDAASTLMCAHSLALF